MQHSHPILAFKPFIRLPPTSYLLYLHPHHRLMLLAVSLHLLLPLPIPNSLRALQRNAGGLQARSTELLHFISFHPVDPICIQESNLNLSSSFRIPEFSALRFDRTHSRSGICSTDAAAASVCGHASGSSIIFVFFFFFWKGSTFSDAGSDGTQPALCVDIQNRQSTYSCRCPMYGACQNDVFCGLFYSATLAI